MKDRARRDAYPEKAASLFANLRKDLGAPEVPVVIGTLGDFLGAPAAEMNSVLRNLPQTIPHCAIADAKGLTDKGDHVHFDSPSARELGKRYAAALKTSGIEVVLKPTDGSSDNLQLLRNGGADVAFVRGGSADPVKDEEAGLTSLGSLFFEPLWFFYRTEAARKIDRKTATLTSLTQFKDLRINVDKPGSGVPDIMDRMFRDNHMDPATLNLSNLEQTPATEALQAGLLDVIVLASAPHEPAYLDSYGWALYQLGRYHEALPPLCDAARRDPGHPEVQAHLGDALWRVGRKDDFFALGGRSLLLPRVRHRLEQELGVRLSLASLLERTTAAALALAAEELLLDELERELAAAR